MGDITAIYTEQPIIEYLEEQLALHSSGEPQESIHTSSLEADALPFINPIELPHSIGPSNPLPQPANTPTVPQSTNTRVGNSLWQAVGLIGKAAFAGVGVGSLLMLPGMTTHGATSQRYESLASEFEFLISRLEAQGVNVATYQDVWSSHPELDENDFISVLDAIRLVDHKIHFEGLDAGLDMLAEQIDYGLEDGNVSTGRLITRWLAVLNPEFEQNISSILSLSLEVPGDIEAGHNAYEISTAPTFTEEDLRFFAGYTTYGLPSTYDLQDIESQTERTRRMIEIDYVKRLAREVGLNEHIAVETYLRQNGLTMNDVYGAPIHSSALVMSTDNNSSNPSQAATSQKSEEEPTSQSTWQELLSRAEQGEIEMITMLTDQETSSHSSGETEIRTLTAEDIDMSQSFDVISSTQKFIIPIPNLGSTAEPLINPDSGEPILDWRGNPIGHSGIVFRNETDQSWQAVPGDGTGVIIINQVSEEQAELISSKIFELNENPEDLTLEQIKEVLSYIQGLDLVDMYNSDRGFIEDQMSPVKSDLHTIQSMGQTFGFMKRDSRDIVRAVAVTGNFQFQGPAATPQIFENGGIILFQDNHEPRGIQRKVFQETYRMADGSPLDI